EAPDGRNEMSDVDTIQPNLRFSQIGKSLTRTDSPGKATGRTPYAGDYVMPGMLHAKVLRADLASARLKRLDVSKARAMPGVACVLTAQDMPDRAIATDIPGQTGRARLKTDQQILVKERVRYLGEPLALAAAGTAHSAAAARRLREVEPEATPGVCDREGPLKPVAPAVQGPGHVVATHRLRTGDTEAGFAAADVVGENTYIAPFQEHAFLD